MRATGRVAVLLVFLVLNGALGSEGAIVRHSGLVIRARELPARKVLPEYWPFEVGIKNTSAQPRTVHAELVLVTGPPASEREVARCAVYREVAPRSSVEWVVQCRSTERYLRFSLVVRRIWKFIP